MVYKGSFESGRTPFVPDTKRGYWAQPSDFIYACLGLAFKMDMFAMGWDFFLDMGVYSVVIHLISLAVFIVPFFLVQAFLGQFSSSGFITSLRISPLFKGLGYISLALNTTLLMYIGVFAAVPLFYLAHSFSPKLPWSCTSLHHLIDETETTCGNGSDYDNNIPSVLFFRTLFTTDSSSINNNIYEEPPSFSFQLLGAMFIVWGLLAIFFNKINIKRMSLGVRYTMWILLLLLLICVTRFAFLEGSFYAFSLYFNPYIYSFLSGLSSAPLYATAAFGAGWGAVISLSSYNKFNTNIKRYSWIICVGQLAIFMLFGLAAKLINTNLEYAESIYPFDIEENLSLYLVSGWVLSKLELPNLWCILFFSFLTLSAILMMAIQLFSLLTAVFDDFQGLRDHKQKVTFGLIGFLFLNSIYFCTNDGLRVFSALSSDVLLSQTVLNLLLLLITIFIYGRERLQRDIQFMLNGTFATWRVYMLRSIGILIVLITLIASTQYAVVNNFYNLSYTQAVYAGFMGTILITVPWLFLPGYAKWVMSLTTGSFRLRLKRSCQPADWYPVEAENHQLYERTKHDINIMQPLGANGGEKFKI